MVAAATGVFATAGAVRDWIEAPWGVAYTVAGVYTLLQRLRIRLKTPRPRHTKADPQGPGGLEKGGLAERLAAAGLKAGQGSVWGDERRVGLRGQVGKVGAPRGVAVAQAVQIGWQYLYVAVALDPRTGRLWWTWQQNMKGEARARIWEVWAAEPAIDGGVWDGAGGHTGKGMQAVGAPQVVPPPYAPELNPVARFFRELRRALEGRVYPTLQAKPEALEPILEAWRADPERVKQVCGWRWIRKALKALPADIQVSQA